MLQLGKYIFVLFVIVCHFSLSAQINISTNKDRYIDERSLWDIQIINQEESFQGKVFIQLYDYSGGLLYEASSNYFSINTGNSNVNYDIIQPLQVFQNRLNDSEKKSSYHYKVQIQTIAGTVVANISKELKVETDFSTSDSIEKEKLVRLGGTARFTAQLATRQGENSEQPANYLRTEITPELNVANIPLGARFYHSTEQNASLQPIMEFNFNFDINTLNQQMQQEAIKKINEMLESNKPEDLEELEKIEGQLKNKSHPKLEEWKAMVDSHQSKLDSLEQMKSQLTRYEKFLSNDAVKKELDKLEQYEKKYNIQSKEELENNTEIPPKARRRMEKMYELKEKAEEVKDKEKEIKKYQKKYKDLEKIAKKLQKLEETDIQQLLNDPNNIKEAHKLLGLSNPLTRFIGNFKRIDIGNSYPYYTDLTFNGARLKGANIVYNLGKFYLNASLGSIQQERQSSSTSGEQEFSYKRQLRALKVGIGKVEDSHLHFIYLEGEDLSNESHYNPNTFTQSTPSSNRVAGVDFSTKLLNKKLRIGGEFNGSIFTSDKTVEQQDSSLLNGGVSEIVSPYTNATSEIDYAYKAFADLDLWRGKTKIKTKIERIGANYNSFGVPFMMQDQFKQDYSLEQSIFKNKLSLNVFYRQNYDRLDPFHKLFRTTTTSIGTTLSLNMQKLPSVSFSYMPYLQYNDLDKSDSSYQYLQNDIMQLNISHSYTISQQVTSFSQLSLMNQKSVSEQSPNIKALITTFTQNFNYKSYNLSLSATYSPYQGDEVETYASMGLNVNFGITLFNKWNNQVGFIYYKRDNYLEEKTGVYYSTSYRINKYMSFDLRLQQNDFNTTNQDNNSFNEWIGNFGLMINW